MTTKSNRLMRLVTSWELSLDSAGRSPKTIRAYTDTARLFTRWFATEIHILADAGKPTPPLTPRGVEPAHLQRFLVHERDRTSPASAAHHYRNLSVWFRWMVSEDILTETKNPMRRVERPHVPEKIVDALTDEEINALYKVIGGKSFEARRDTVILDILQDNGMRVSGLVGLRISDDPERNDVFLSRKRLRIILKGGDEFLVPIGRTTARDIDRYLRAREDHPAALSERLLVGKRGPMTASGVQQMLKRRAHQAGIKRSVHPHMFRHGFADEWLAAGGSESDLMNICGWSSYDMVRRYAQHAAQRRALEAHAVLSPTDRRRAA